MDFAWFVWNRDHQGPPTLHRISWGNEAPWPGHPRISAAGSAMTATSPSPLLSVYSGRDCIGFVYARGRSGFEAFTADQKSLGVFRTQREAATAIPEIKDER